MNENIFQEIRDALSDIAGHLENSNKIKVNAEKFSHKISHDGIELGILKCLKIINDYKLSIFHDDNILSFTAICELEEKVKELIK